MDNIGLINASTIKDFDREFDERADRNQYKI